MDKIKRFIECYIPVSVCNMRCSYCYVIQEGRRNNSMPKFKYSIKQMKKSLTIDRLGGVCYFNLCGLGETLLPKEMPEIIYMLLENGHYVNVTNNGTSTYNIEKIIKFPKRYLSHLSFSFSFHYLELKKLNMMNLFFDNINKVRKAGCSFVLQLNWCDDYLPYIEEIKKLSYEKVGALPQIALTREETDQGIKVLTNQSEEKYVEIARSFGSELFEMTLQNFNVKRNEFCYAGDWSFILNMENGMIKKCYAEEEKINIFENPKKPIRFEALGKNCSSPYCVNSSHFLSLGVIPELLYPSYYELRNRKNSDWYSEEMKNILNQKLYNNNVEYSSIKKTYTTFKIKSYKFLKKLVYKTYKKIKNFIN